MKTKITEQVPPINFIIYTSKHDVWMSGVSVVGANALQVIGNLTFDAKIQKIIGGTFVILVSTLI